MNNIIIKALSSKKQFIFLLFIAIFFTLSGCRQKDEALLNLEKIDMLLHQEKADSAYNMILKIKKEDLNDNEKKAYYNMLITWSRYVNYLPFNTNTLINQSISFYQSKKDYKKLALALAIKGEAIYEIGNTRVAIDCLKRCELIANNINDLFLKDKLYGAFTMINCQQNEYELALKYGKKRLEVAHLSKNRAWIAGSLNQIAVCFYGLEELDSACSYINKCIPYIKYIDNYEKGIIFDNIGFFNIKNNPDTALKYLRKAEKINPSVDTYDNLAQIYAKQGKFQIADSMWNLALNKASLKQKVTITENIIKYNNQKTEKYILSLKSKLIVLKDSLNRIEKQQKVEKQQSKFDDDIAQKKNESSINLLKKGLGTCFFIAVLIITFILYRQKQYKRNQEDIIESFKYNLDNQKKTIEKQNKTILSNKHIITKQQNEIEQKTIKIRHGFELYKQICQHNTIVKWDKRDYADFFDYYSIIKRDFMDNIYKQFPQATVRQRIYLILEEKGWEAQDIAQCLGIEQKSLRTIKYRINKKQM